MKNLLLLLFLLFIINAKDILFVKDHFYMCCSCLSIGSATMLIGRLKFRVKSRSLRSCTWSLHSVSRWSLRYFILNFLIEILFVKMVNI